MSTWSKYFQTPSLMEYTRMRTLSTDELPVLAKHLFLRDGIKILDVGCGSGLFAYHLSRQVKGCMIYGIDMDEDFIKEARRHILPDNTFHFVTGDALHMPFEDETFDLVVSHTFMTNISPPEDALYEMHRVCKTGGRIASLTASVIKNFYGWPGNPSFSYAKVTDTLNKLELQAQRMYETLAPFAQYIQGAEPEQIPHLFHQCGLSHIAIHPSGVAFSTSSADIEEPMKEKLAQLEYQSSIDRFNAFSKRTEFADFFSEQEARQYRILLEKRLELRLAELSENTEFNALLLTNVVVVGEKLHAHICTNTIPCFHEEPYKTLLAACGVQDTTHREVACTDSIYSFSLVLSPLNICVYGTGESRQAARQDAYERAVIRLCPGDLPVSIPDKDMLQPVDSDTLSQSSLVKQFSSRITATSKISSLFGSYDLLKNWQFSTAGDFSCFPFVDEEKQVAYIPQPILSAYCHMGGIGVAPDQVHAEQNALCDALENYAAANVLDGTITLHEILLNNLHPHAGIYKEICQINASGRYVLRIFDIFTASGLPVAVTRLEHDNRYIMGFGADIDFECALKKSMTHLFRGRSLDNDRTTSFVDFSTDVYTKSLENRHNYLAGGRGICPTASFFVPTDGLPFHQLQCSLKDLLVQKGFQLYHLYSKQAGLTICRIIIPEISMLFGHGSFTTREHRHHHQILPVLQNPGAYTATEWKSAALYLTFKVEQTAQNSFAFLTQQTHTAVAAPGVPHCAATLLLQFYCLLKDYKAAFPIAQQLAAMSQMDLNFYPFKLLFQMISGMLCGLTEKEVLERIGGTFSAADEKWTLDFIQGVV